VKAPLPPRVVPMSSGGRLLGCVSTILMHLSMPLGLRIQPAGRVVRELPPSFRVPSIRFSPTRPRLVSLLTDGVRAGPKKKNPRDLRLRRYLWRRQTQALWKREFPPKGKRTSSSTPQPKTSGVLTLFHSPDCQIRLGQDSIGIFKPVNRQKKIPRIARGINRDLHRHGSCRRCESLNLLP